MPIRRVFVTVVLAALLLPAGASGGVRLVPREEPAGAVRASLARPAPLAFNMVGIHWLGTGEVWFRTAAEYGRWGPWRPARPEDEDLPDLGTDEAARSTDGWNVGNPYWTGGARWIQYRTAGSVRRVRSFFIESRVEGTAMAASSGAAAASAEPGSAVATRMPAVIRRAQWGADESIVRDAPSYAERLRLAVVHHTAGANSYSRSQSAAIVRGIQRYHVLANGWDDIGYNFLVDKHGQVFEGRGGGIAKNVVGAHAQGFNTGSVGVAVLGTYEAAGIAAPARRAIRKLLAWRLDVAHVDPRSRLTFTSYGNPRFPEGTRVRLRALSGHRDTGYTSCPGRSLYGQLDPLAAGVAAVGLPKLYNPTVSGAVGSSVRFQGRLSSARAWRVQVEDATGAVVAHRGGTGTAIDWTWDASAFPGGAYTYVMSSGAEVRPARGAVPSPPPLAVVGLKLRPPVLTPNGDGRDERTRVSFTLSRRARVSATIRDSGGAVVRRLLPEQERPGGFLSLVWRARDDGGAPVEDGRYRLRVAATTGVEAVTRVRGVVVDRTLRALAVSPGVFSPNGDGRLELADISFQLTRRADVEVTVRRGGKDVRTLHAGFLPARTHSVSWDGRTDRGPAGDGRYSVLVRATTTLGTRRLSGPVRLDTTPPRVRVLSLLVVRGVTRLRFWLSEPARLHVWFGRRVWTDGDSLVRDRPAGEQLIRRRGAFRVVRLRPYDEAAITGPAVVFRR